MATHALFDQIMSTGLFVCLCMWGLHAAVQAIRVLTLFMLNSRTPYRTDEEELETLNLCEFQVERQQHHAQRLLVSSWQSSSRPNFWLLRSRHIISRLISCSLSTKLQHKQCKESLTELCLACRQRCAECQIQTGCVRNC